MIRTNVAIVGAMNAGKSTLMNLLTQQSTSIVDSRPGTTADAKVALLELHRLGPTRLLDTPGADEPGELGAKKRARAEAAVREADVAVAVVDPLAPGSAATARAVLASAPASAQRLVVYNLRGWDAERARGANAVLDAAEAAVGVPDGLAVDLSAPGAFARVVEYVCARARPHASAVPLLPPRPLLARGDRVLLNIPMDGETPSGRLLRPQSLVQEALLRAFVGTFAHRMDLKHARGAAGPDALAAERARFDAAVRDVAPRLLVTDSQAIDVVAPWTAAVPGLAVTTFSVAMANYLSGGRLAMFVDGLRAFDALRPGDAVLVCEACNHDRIEDDIGTVQIPAALRRRFGDGAIRVDHAFGREYMARDLSQYALLLHCGGCMLDQQKMDARLRDLAAAGVPISNYGLLLSHLQSPDVLRRVVAPFLDAPPS